MIEVNEYVRTKNGYIVKVDENTIIFNLGYKEQYVDMETTKYGFTCEEEIVKHSKQLIDLVEVGDILKIKISEEWVEKQDTIKFVVVGQTYTITEIKECLENGLFKIIQILTKEQFEANCYKVGGEEDEQI